MKEIIEKLKNAEYLHRIDTNYFIEDSGSIEELYEMIENAISEYEIIYYSVAMELLSEEDPSLTESLSLAHEMGYEPKDLSSEILATLLIQQRMLEELWEIV